MTTHKSLPYKVHQEYDIINILKHRHEIPYHSRPFSWTREQYIERIVRDAFDAWQKKEYYWLGVVILYTGGRFPSITDAQHRITICYMMILCLAQKLKSDEPLSWISSYGGSSILRAKVPEEDQAILTENEWARFPNIVSCYDQDFNALGHLLNDKGKPVGAVHSDIYDAYTVIQELITEKMGCEPDNMSSFLRFLYEDVKVLRIDISDWKFTLSIFNSFNNIKVQVPASYLLKNRITQIEGEGNDEIVHRTFESLPHESSKKYESLVYLLSMLMTRKFTSREDYMKDVDVLPLSETPLEDFRQVYTDYNEMSKQLEGCPYYRILKSQGISCELWNMCIAPISFMALKSRQRGVSEMLCRALVAYGIRIGKTVSFNAIKYQSALEGVINDVLSGSIQPSDALSKMLELLKKWLGEDGKSTIATMRLQNDYWIRGAFQRARAALLYLVERTDTHESRLDHNAVQIDHVYPKTPSKSCPPLTNPDMRHRIGNFTPFVGKNTADGEMKGNMSLGNKSFSTKQPHYAKSNIAMTRELASYTVFADAEIEARSAVIARRLVELTAADLKLPL